MNLTKKLSSHQIILVAVFVMLFAIKSCSYIVEIILINYYQRLITGLHLSKSYQLLTKAN